MIPGCNGIVALPGSWRKGVCSPGGESKDQSLTDVNYLERAQLALKQLEERFGVESGCGIDREFLGNQIAQRIAHVRTSRVGLVDF
jgi:hypothetical protein